MGEGGREGGRGRGGREGGRGGRGVKIVASQYCFNTWVPVTQLLDAQGTGQMTFGAFTQLFGVMSRTTLQVYMYAFTVEPPIVDTPKSG